ncbi:MAG: aldo/keto reductase [Marinilabiliaceae bacterium]|nr:aldo/keto reductase [Marinilabiliaceae bacterium]
MKYNRVGKSGLKLPQVSLGLWHNFGSVDSFENAQSILKYAFENGVTHFDLANNYGPEPGSAEVTLGKVLRSHLRGHRDELVISTKAGYKMWEGPYGDGGSRKYLISSLDQSLKRMGLDYVDIFYHHRPDPETPIEETMMALDHIVRSGRALYVGISNYHYNDSEKAFQILKELGTPCIIHQAKYNMFERWVEEERMLELLEQWGVGLIAFSPLAQGLLTDRYINGIPEGSRITHSPFLTESTMQRKLPVIKQLNDLATKEMGVSLSTLALRWIMRDERVTSVLVGASSVEQLQKNMVALEENALPHDVSVRIEEILRAVETA